MKANKRNTAAVFMSGTSQAVRLPKQYRFNTDRVFIAKQGNAVLLTPAPKSWADVCKGRPEDVNDWLNATTDDDLGSYEQRAPFK